MTTSARRLRIFVALPMPRGVMTQLVAVQQALGQVAKRSATTLQLVPTHQFHVTLAFLGEIDETDLHLVINTTRDVLAHCGAFHLNATGLVVFPSAQRARVVAMALEATDDSLVRAVAVLHSGLRSAGFALERRTFLAHVTLARLGAPGRLLLEPELSAIQVSPFVCSTVTVYQSRPRNAGAQYRAHSTFLFGD